MTNAKTAQDLWAELGVLDREELCDKIRDLLFQIEAMGTRNDDLQEQVTELHKRLKEAARERSHLAERLAAGDGDRCLVADMEARNQHLGEKLAAEEAVTRDFQEQLKASRKERIRLEGENYKLERRVELIKAKLVIAEHALVSERKIAQEQIRAQNGDAGKQYADLRSQYEQQLRMVTGQRDGYHAAGEVVKGQLETTREALREARAELHVQARQLDAAYTSAREWAQEVGDARDEIAKLTKDVETLKEGVSRSQALASETEAMRRAAGG